MHQLIRIDALLAEGFTRREIRRYVEKRVLPPAVGRGTSAYYTEGHILILRRIRQARESRRTLVDLAEEAHRAHPGLFRPGGPRRSETPEGPEPSRRAALYAVPGSYRDGG